MEDIYHEIGVTAGKIWEYLNKNGETDLIKLKIDLNLKNTHLFLALGWLSRENKVIIKYEKGNFTARLK